MISAAIFALWGVAIALKLAAAVGIFRRGLYSGYPVLAAFLVVASLRSLILVFVTLRDGSPGYVEAWFLSTWFTHLLYILVSAEAFFQFVRHMPRVRNFAFAMFTALLGISVAIGASLSGAGMAEWALQPLESGSRNIAGVLLLFLLLTETFWRVLRLPCVHHNAYRNTLNLQLLFAGEALARWAVVGTGGDYWVAAAAQLVLLGSASAAFALWAFRFPAAGEFYMPLVRPQPLEEKARHNVAGS